MKGSKFNGAETPTDDKIRVHKNGATQKAIEIKVGAVNCDASIPYSEVVGSLL